MEAINNAISVYDTLGNLLSGPEALSQFWGLTPEIDRVTGITGQFVSDPKCVYDAGIAPLAAGFIAAPSD